MEESAWKINATTGFFIFGSASNASRADAVTMSTLDLGPEGCWVSTENMSFVPWANPDGLLTAETFYLMDRAVQGGLVPCLSLVGTATNVLNLLVFYMQGLSARINLLLFSLAVSDLLVEVYLLIISLEPFWTLLEGQFQAFGPVTEHLINARFGLLYAFTYVSGFIVSLVAAERYLCTARPFVARRFFKTRTAGMVVTLAGGLLVGLHYLVTNKFRMRCVRYAALGYVAASNYYPSDFYLQHKALADFADAVFFGLACPCLFILTTTLATLLTALALRRAVIFRRSQGRAYGEGGGGRAAGSGIHDARVANKEVTLTKMLIAASGLFVACTVPNVLIRLLPVAMPSCHLGGRNHNLFMLGVVAVHLTAALSGSLHFFCYLYLGSRFRQTLAALFSRGCLSRLSPVPAALSGKEGQRTAAPIVVTSLELRN